MRIMSIIFYILTTIAAILWILFYAFVSAMACAFGSPNGNCRTKMPWELHGEDLIFLVVTPGVIVLILLLIAILCGRAAQNS